MPAAPARASALSLRSIVVLLPSSADRIRTRRRETRRMEGGSTGGSTDGGVRWAELEAQAPELAAAGRRLLYQFGLGLGFLATVRPNGGPRLHPFCPIVAEGGLWGFIAPSPKQHDLRRDG